MSKITIINTVRWFLFRPLASFIYFYNWVVAKKGMRVTIYTKGGHKIRVHIKEMNVNSKQMNWKQDILADRLLYLSFDEVEAIVQR